MTGLDAFAAARMETIFERFPATFDTAQGPRAVIDGQDLALFSSSNYLGLAEHPALAAAAARAIEAYGVGAGGSRLTTGTTAAHRALEERLAEFFGYEDAVFFATGYQTNLSTIGALAAGGQVTVLSDERNHASIIDGVRLSGAPKRVFPHGDCDKLAAALAARDTPYALVVSDGLFSMDGTVADVPRLQRVCQENGAWLLIDDAHAVGTLGASGRGTAELFGGRPDVVVGTASKALGAEGGFALCNAAVGRLLRNSARSFIFSTAPAPAVCAAVSAALDLLTAQRVAQLRRVEARLARGLIDAGIWDSARASWATPIFPVPVGDERAAVAVSARLREAGYFAPAIRFPTVPRGQAIVRITVMATHSEKDVAGLVAALAAALDTTPDAISADRGWQARP